MANRSWLITYQPGLSRQIQRLRPDVTIGDGFGQWSLPLILRRAVNGTPFVLCYERTAHTERNAQWLRRIYRRQVCRLVDAACVNGGLCAEYVSSLGISNELITRGFMAADDRLPARIARIGTQERDEFRAEFHLSATVYLFVGRLVDRKGVLPLVRSWIDAMPDVPDAVLAIAGEGEREGEVSRLVEQRGVKNVRIVGAIPYERMEYLYAASDVLVMPTLEDNWSLVVPEAMSCGLPVINSIYNGCWPELTIEGRTGWVFDPLDPHSFANALRTAHANRHAFPEMAEECRRVAGQYTPQTAARAIYDACKIALARKSRDRFGEH